MNDHHAFVIEGGVHDAVLFVRDFCTTNFGISVVGNPDYIELAYVQCGVEEARALKTHQVGKSLHGKKVLVCSFSSITHEAQNAVLKLLEEPNEGVHIFLIPQSKDVLLPTIISRVRTMHVPDRMRQKEYSGFISKTLSERLTIVENLISAIEKGQKTKIDAIALLDAIITELRDGQLDKTGTLARIVRLRSYFFARTQSTKQLLEYMAYRL